jgi:hypothetical protein
MKKIFLTAGIITLLITGAGCANSSETNKQTPTATQQSRSSTTPAVNLSTAIEASPADFLKIQNKLNLFNSIEILILKQNHKIKS